MSDKSKPEAGPPRKGEDLYADYLKQIADFKERQKDNTRKDVLGRGWKE